ncbi:hypothetical protein PLICRDRAFT_34825 [Plicaturopsis crispa FD-325 SS-3]|nr:hypothetical protein PLICRDRAFT_34825 [Plicaturopsis crispa FD-325 SS-3]
MEPSMALSSKQIAQKAVQANKDHQYALKVYTERLEAELETVERLLNTADVADQDDEPELNVKGSVAVPNSTRPTGPILFADFLSDLSPFRDDAEKRQRYIEFTAAHTMRNKELEILAEAVRTENYRKHAFDAQRRGQQPFELVHDKNYFEINKEGLDWDRIADTVSQTSAAPRSARECMIRWLGDRHPDFNHGPWTQPEIAQLTELTSGKEEGEIDWVDVARELGTKRTPVDCMRHAIHRHAHTWGDEGDRRLMDAVKTYGLENWGLVARNVSEDATPSQCSSRYYRALDPNLKHRNWTDEEDDRLRQAVQAYGKSWVDVAVLMPGRNNDQCRDRWTEKLDPGKTRWSEEDDDKLLEAVETLGTEWAQVMEHVGNGYTDKMCKARYEALKRKRGKRSQKNFVADSSTSPEAEDSIPKPPMPQRSIVQAPPPRARRRTSEAAAAAATAGDEDVASENVGQPSRPRPRPRPRARKGKAPATDETSPSAPDSTNNTPDSDDEEVPTPKPKKRPVPRKRAAASRDDAGPSKKKRKIAAQTELRDSAGPSTQPIEEGPGLPGASGDVDSELQQADEAMEQETEQPRGPRRRTSTHHDKSPARPPRHRKVTKKAVPGAPVDDAASPAIESAGPSTKKTTATAPTRKQPTRAASRKSLS